MIHVALLRKNLRDSALLWGGCAIALFAISWVRVWFVSRVEMSRFQQIIELLPSDWRRFSSVDFEWLITYTGRISLVFDEPGIVLCLSIWAIARGSDVVSGELNRGTMEMLLAQPVSRMQIFFTHALVTTIGTLLLAVLTLAGTTGGILSFSVKEQRSVSPLPIQLPFPTPFDRTEEVSIPLRDEVDPADYFVGARNFAALGFMLAGVSAAVSAFDRYRWRTLGIVVSAYIVSLMLKTFGLASETTEWLGYFSVFSAYEPKLLVKIVAEAPQLLWALRVDSSIDGTNGLGPLGFDAILLSIGLAGYIMGAWRFHVRDLPAPMSRDSRFCLARRTRMDKRDFLSVLIFMAGSDGKFSDDEVRRLLTFADKSGLSAADVEQALADAADPAYPSPKPETPEEAERLLSELLKIMAADGELHDMEKMIFSDLAGSLGFDHDELKDLIDRTLKKAS